MQDKGDTVMKWSKPLVKSYKEQELLAKLAAKAQTHGDTFGDVF